MSHLRRVMKIRTLASNLRYDLVGGCLFLRDAAVQAGSAPPTGRTTPTSDVRRGERCSWLRASNTAAPPT